MKEGKVTLTVEWLPAYNQYRVWNTWVEGWFDTWEQFEKHVKDNELLDIYDFVSYDVETQKKLEELK